MNPESPAPVTTPPGRSLPWLLVTSGLCTVVWMVVGALLFRHPHSVAVWAGSLTWTALYALRVRGLWRDRPARSSEVGAVPIAVLIAVSLATSWMAATAMEDTGPVYRQATLDQLRVEPEHSSLGYSRGRFMPGGRWDDTDQDCQDTRQELLIAESREPVALDDSGCHVVSGSWWSPYDGVAVFDHPDPALHVDHVVALKQAWRSGADTWSPAARRAYANDLANAETLIIVTAHANEQKSDRDPARWRPRTEDWCRYAGDVVAIKAHYNLSVDQAEHDALAEMLGTCAA